MKRIDGIRQIALKFEMLKGDIDRRDLARAMKLIAETLDEQETILHATARRAGVSIDDLRLVIDERNRSPRGDIGDKHRSMMAEHLLKAIGG